MDNEWFQAIALILFGFLIALATAGASLLIVHLL